MTTATNRIRLLMLYALLTLPFLVWGASQALKANNNSPIDWVGPEFKARAAYDRFTASFGPGDAVIISWDGCRIDDPRLDKLTDVFRKATPFRNSAGKSWFYRVISGRETFLHLTGAAEPDQDSEYSFEGSQPQPGRRSISDDLAVKRLQGTLIGPDGKSTCLILVFSREGLDQRAHVVNLIRKTVRVCLEIEDSDLHLAGPIIDGLTVDEASQRSLAAFAVPSSAIIFLICWISLRSFRGALLVFGTAAWSQGATLAIIHYGGETLSALLIVIPPLIQVLSVAGGIHLTNYYFESLPFMSPREAAVACFRVGWLPCTLSAATTAMGTASLMISGLEPIRLFGVYATVGVIIQAAAVMTVVPCGLMMYPIARRFSTDAGKPQPDTVDPAILSAAEFETADAWLRIRDFLVTRNSLSLTVITGFMVAAGFGLPRITTSVRIETLFSNDHQLIRDYRWLEEKIGPLIPVEVLLTFDANAQLNNRQQMDRLFRVQKALRGIPHISATMSALTFFPDLPEMKGLPVRLRAATVNKAVESALPMFEQAEVLKRTADSTIWRITGHCSATAPLDYGELLQQIDNALQPIALEVDGSSTSGFSVATSGIMPLVHQIQGQLLKDLFESFVSALIVITITMTIVEGGILKGLLSMISNIFPIVMLFGLMGLRSIPMDIGSVMTASVALGIAVDDTLHFLTFFRRSIARGLDRSQAVLFSYRHCGRAMIQTSVTCSLGMLVFGLSDFAPTSRFAVMLVGLLILAILGDLVLLPTLLLSPFGKIFEQHEMDHARPESIQSTH
jgi:predicted RND superfamily exporter protein